METQTRSPVREGQVRCVSLDLKKLALSWASFPPKDFLWVPVGHTPGPGAPPTREYSRVGCLALLQEEAYFLLSLFIFFLLLVIWSFPGGTSGKEPACQCRRLGDVNLTPGSGRSPGERYGNPLHYSCLENPMDGGAWQATVHGVQRVEHDLVTEHIHTHIIILWSNCITLYYIRIFLIYMNKIYSEFTFYKIIKYTLLFYYPKHAACSK